MEVIKKILSTLIRPIGIPMVGILLVLGLAGGGLFLYQRTKLDLEKVKNDPTILQEAAKVEVKKLVEEVGKLVALPEGEDPTVATVTDAEKLKQGQQSKFFEKAQNGDKLLIFSQAKKAILYRPSEKKILEIAPINIGQNQVAGLASAKFAIYNGTGVSGLSKGMEDEVKKVVQEAEISSRANAVKTDYEETIIIDLAGDKGDSANQIAQALGIKVGTLPEGETRPDGVDFLIIIGRDKAPQESPTPTPQP